jgi:DNA transformation protein
MSNSPSFVEHALDLLSGVGLVRARAMFGGHGLYCGDVMFGLLDDDELFLKTDADCRRRFIEAGCRMWVFPGSAETSYYRPPDDAHEDVEAMLPWARLALDAARRGRTAKAARAKATARRSSSKAAPARKVVSARKPVRRPR